MKDPITGEGCQCLITTKAQACCALSSGDPVFRHGLFCVIMCNRGRDMIRKIFFLHLLCLLYPFLCPVTWLKLISEKIFTTRQENKKTNNLFIFKSMPSLRSHNCYPIVPYVPCAAYIQLYWTELSMWPFFLMQPFKLVSRKLSNLWKNRANVCLFE